MSGAPGSPGPTTSITPARTIWAAATPGLWSMRPAPVSSAPTGDDSGVTAHRAIARISSSAGASPWLEVTRVVSASTMAAKSATRLRRTRSARWSSRASGESLDEQLGGDVEQFGVAVGQRPVDGPEGLDGHPVHFEDLVPQQVEQVVAGQADPEFVDHRPVVPLEDVDRHHVPADRADPTGHGAERAGAVGQLDADQVVGHGVRVEGNCVGTVSSGLRTRRRHERHRPALPRRLLLPTGVLVDVLLAGQRGDLRHQGVREGPQFLLVGVAPAAVPVRRCPVRVRRRRSGDGGTEPHGDPRGTGA